MTQMVSDCMSCATPERSIHYYDEVPPMPVTSRKRQRSPSQPVFRKTRRCLAYFYPSPEKTSRMEMVGDFLPSSKRRMTEPHKGNPMIKPLELHKAKPIFKPSAKKMHKHKQPLIQRKEVINRNVSLSFEEMSLGDKQQKAVVDDDDDVFHFSATMMSITWVPKEDSDNNKVHFDLT
ncbi:uncharacterized protein LOC112567294 isoform X2 [Pomacea canaliculata]|uniref:uncharacterized protein LOC112567294 isoform X2 n=1 Tax=Pomacea canaliculata TaxID=400727 RepID=UPI000D7391EB|nr:uncharacterized protein LOC112567294 isoform X2 [Pomacea canaliculata]